MIHNSEWTNPWGRDWYARAELVAHKPLAPIEWEPQGERKFYLVDHTTGAFVQSPNYQHDIVVVEG